MNSCMACWLPCCWRLSSIWARSSSSSSGGADVLMTCQPNWVSTGSLISPGSRAAAASSNGSTKAPGVS